MSQTLTQAQKDALIAETLGDVGLLRDEVAGLLAEIRLLPGEIAKVRDSSIVEIQKAADAAAIDGAKDLSARFIQAVSDEASRAASASVVSALDPASARLVQAAAKIGTESTWLKGRTAFAWRISLAVGAASSAVTALIFIGALVALGPHGLTPDQTRQMKVGQSLDRAWPALDEATRNRVQRAIDATSPEK